MSIIGKRRWYEIDIKQKVGLKTIWFDFNTILVKQRGVENSQTQTENGSKIIHLTDDDFLFQGSLTNFTQKRIFMLI